MINEIKGGKHKQFHRSSFTILFSLIVFISGCSGSIKHSIKQYIRPNTDISAIRAIAVLPLENFTSDNYADGKIKSKIIIELLSRGIDVIEPGEVVMTLRELRVRSIDSIRTEDIQNIGKTLNVDAVMLGSVEAFGISKGITVSYPEVTVHLILFETASGKIIWSAWHTTGGASFWTRHFGAEGRTLDNASAMVIKETFDALF
jgi:TolB-like protein